MRYSSPAAVNHGHFLIQQYMSFILAVMESFCGVATVLLAKPIGALLPNLGERWAKQTWMRYWTNRRGTLAGPFVRRYGGNLDQTGNPPHDA